MIDGPTPAWALLVCGSRDWSDPAPIRRELAVYPPFETVVIEGEADGADQIARKVALALGIRVVRCPAPWRRFGAIEGPARNHRMMRHLIELRQRGAQARVMAFHEAIGRSKGTKDMLALAASFAVEAQLFRA